MFISFQDPIPDLVPQDVLDHPVALRVAQDPLDLDRAVSNLKKKILFELKTNEILCDFRSSSFSLI